MNRKTTKVAMKRKHWFLIIALGVAYFFYRLWLNRDPEKQETLFDKIAAARAAGISEAKINQTLGQVAKRSTKF